jgi:hypothetical protein
LVNGCTVARRRCLASPLSIQNDQHALEGPRIKVAVDVNAPPLSEINHDRTTLLVARRKANGLVLALVPGVQRSWSCCNGCHSSICVIPMAAVIASHSNCHLAHDVCVTRSSTTETLLGEDKAADAGACELCQPGDNVLLTAPSWIHYGRHRFRELGHSHRLAAVAGMPTIEEIHRLAAGGVIRLDLVDAGITTSERNERIPAPSGPILIATERPARNKVRGILSAIAPDGECRGEQLRPICFDIRQEPTLKCPLLGIFTSRVQFTNDEAPHKVHRQGNAVAGHENECRAVE